MENASAISNGMALPPPELHTAALDPVRAEVLVDVSAWPLAPADEIRGKLVGPQCRYAGTIEIAYPIRPKPGGGYHVLIPEPSLWEPQTPFVYTGKIEWRRGAQKVHECHVLHGLMQLRKTPKGWTLNGRPLILQTAEVTDPTEETLLKLHAEGCNTLVVAEPKPPFLECAARLGFLVLAAAPTRAFFTVIDESA